MKHQLTAMKRIVSVLCTCLTLLAVQACSWQTQSPSPATSSSGKPSAQLPRQLAIFTPRDGITLSEHTPLNKWAAFVPELQQALEKEHIAKQAITSSTNTSLTDQSLDIQDFVVSNSAAASKITTLVVAPVVEPDEVIRQYGDYVSRPLKGPAQAAAAHTQEGNGQDEGADVSTSSKQTELSKAYTRLVTSLELARKNGMHVVILAHNLPGFTPDLLVQFSTPEQIGQVQAQQLVNKLELDKAKKDNPRSVEVLLPAPAKEADPSLSSSQTPFAQEAFKGIWQVLSPYFADGRAVSPSNLLTSKSSEADWRKLTFDPGSDTTATSNELSKRLANTKDKTRLTPIDGVIAMNDFIASGVTSSLHDMGYTGSSADINPEISIGGIVNNMTGKKDVVKAPVPRPKSADPAESGPTAHPDSSQPSKAEPEQEENESAQPATWPIVTGYGAYIDNIAQIVDGQQWMTALEDRSGIAQSLALAIHQLTDNQAIDQHSDISTLEIQGKKILTLSKPVLPVSASNLKASLIDSGYIKPADAGL